MDRWNPNIFLKKGRANALPDEYLNKLAEVGRAISAHNVPVVYSLAHLAKLTNTLYSDLHAIVGRADLYKVGYPYKNFPIRKRSGGTRWISVPIPVLMIVQSWIAKNILNAIAPHRAAFAYVPDLKSPLKAHGEKHCSAQWVLKVDIKNFFGCISERRVFQVFERLNYPKLLCLELTRLCTKVSPHRRGKQWMNESTVTTDDLYACKFVGSLPQGAPTSPALSNLVCLELDTELELLAQQHGATYSRYADDLCFSFTLSNRSKVAHFKKLVCAHLHKHGFSENKKKTRIIPPGARKIVTGLVLNDVEPKIPRELRDRIRMHLYYSKKHGIPEHCRCKGFRSVIGFRNHLWGLIMYVLSINKFQGENFQKEFLKLPWVKYEI